MNARASSFAGLTMVVAALLVVAPAVAADLVMYTRTGCPFCVRFEREVAPVYDKTPEGRLAPLQRITLPAGGVSGAGLREPVFATPTFVLMQDGREAGRITGYLNDDMFWGLLGRLIAGLAPPAPTGTTSKALVQ